MFLHRCTCVANLSSQQHSGPTQARRDDGLSPLHSVILSVNELSSQYPQCLCLFDRSMSCPSGCSSQIRDGSSLCTSLTPHAGLCHPHPLGVPNTPEGRQEERTGRDRAVLAPFKALLQCLPFAVYKVHARACLGTEILKKM